MTFGLKNASKTMPHKTKIQKIKLFIKISVVVVVFFIFIVLGFFVKPVHTFENANMKKWLTLSGPEQITTIQRILPEINNQSLLIDCVTKIARLPNSNEMIIRDAVALCYGGIKLNTISDEK